MFPGKGNIVMTGSLGDVMRESANLALDYIKANYEKFNIDYSLFENKDIKMVDLVDLLYNTNIAMTGEMTLRGKVLAIGGLKEKVIGAHRNGIRTIFIPSANEKDLDEIPNDIKQEINFIMVDRYLQISERLFRKRSKENWNELPRVV